MHTLAKPSGNQTLSTALVWRGFAVHRGDASTISSLTRFSRNYVDKVLRGKRRSEEVQQAALKFYQLREELQG